MPCVNVKSLLRMEELLADVPEEYKEIYRRHWNTIRKSVKSGIIREVYHFPLFHDSKDEILEFTDEVLRARHKFKVNVAFGFILSKRHTDELKFYHPSNNTMLFETPRLVANVTDLRNVRDDIENSDPIEYARLQRPSTKWQVARIICVRFDVYKLS